MKLQNFKEIIKIYILESMECILKEWLEENSLHKILVNKIKD